MVRPSIGAAPRVQTSNGSAGRCASTSACGIDGSAASVASGCSRRRRRNWSKRSDIVVRAPASRSLRQAFDRVEVHQPADHGLAVQAFDLAGLGLASHGAGAG